MVPAVGVSTLLLVVALVLGLVAVVRERSLAGAGVVLLAIVGLGVL